MHKLNDLEYRVLKALYEDMASLKASYKEAVDYDSMGGEEYEQVYGKLQPEYDLDDLSELKEELLDRLGIVLDEIFTKAEE